MDELERVSFFQVVMITLEIGEALICGSLVGNLDRLKRHSRGLHEELDRSTRIGRAVDERRAECVVALQYLFHCPTEAIRTLHVHTDGTIESLGFQGELKLFPGVLLGQRQRSLTFCYLFAAGLESRGRGQAVVVLSGRQRRAVRHGRGFDDLRNLHCVFWSKDPSAHNEMAFGGSRPTAESMRSLTEAPPRIHKPVRKGVNTTQRRAVMAQEKRMVPNIFPDVMGKKNRCIGR